MEKGKEGGRGWRRGGERAQEGKGWENHAVNRGGPGEASRLRCGTVLVNLTFVQTPLN